VDRWTGMISVCAHFVQRVGAVVAQFVEALCYKPEGRRFDSR
jgi:hypothetical protein